MPEKRQIQDKGGRLQANMCVSRALSWKEEGGANPQTLAFMASSWNLGPGGQEMTAGEKVKYISAEIIPWDKALKSPSAFLIGDTEELIHPGRLCEKKEASCKT